ncbi:MAG: hypothetical protein JWO31_3627 [Phycisphaerales bacterium]|nr:hypothetical protein [Phycisphaerales bacterium]
MHGTHARPSNTRIRTRLSRWAVRGRPPPCWPLAAAGAVLLALALLAMFR